MSKKRKGKKHGPSESQAAPGASVVAAPAATAEPPAATPPASGPSAAAPVEPGRSGPPETAGRSRREFLSLSGSGLVALCGLGALAGAVRFAIPEIKEGPPRRFPVGKPADFKIRTLTWLRRHDLFVIRDQEGFGAFSSRCTHLGCAVQRTAEGFQCPCHGARYDRRGQVLAGPARQPLPWYRLWLEPDGQIWVDLDRTVENGPSPLAPASGGGA